MTEWRLRGCFSDYNVIAVAAVINATTKSYFTVIIIKLSLLILGFVLPWTQFCRVVFRPFYLTAAVK